jgi:hypothetical protein
MAIETTSAAAPGHVAAEGAPAPADASATAGTSWAGRGSDVAVSGGAVSGGAVSGGAASDVAASGVDRAGAAKVRGPGRLLVAVYAVFAVAATSRAVVQILTKFHEAPVAYVLSAVAGVVYVLATVGLGRLTPAGRRLALGACAAELTGVLTVGTLSVADRGLFPDAAVWSGYGEGYGFFPLVLPVLGLWWLRRSGTRPPAPENQAP